MPRRVEDIIINDRRSVRSVRAEKPVERVRMPAERIRVTPPPIKDRPRKASRANKAKKISLLAFLAVVLIVAGTAYIASTYFSRATFTIVPVTIPVSVDNVTIVATGTSTSGYLRYEILKYSGVASTSIPAADGQYISAKASGAVVLYNSYSTQGQRLIAGTRFIGENGMTYRLPSSIFIPGYSSTNGSLVPGTIKTAVVADEAGAQYDMARANGTDMLKIAAYQGSPRYDTVYARLASDIAGGFAGAKKTVNQALLASTTKDIQDMLTKSLLVQAKAGVPADYVTYDNAYGTVFADPAIGGSTAHSATITVTGTLYSVIFKKTDLAAKLAGQGSIDRFGKSAYSISGLESLKFAITNPGTFRPAKANTLIARLNGNIELTGTVSIDGLRSKLAGLPLSGTQGVFASYSSVIDIAKSSGELFPSWSGAVPKDLNRISIILK